MLMGKKWPSTVATINVITANQPVYAKHSHCHSRILSQDFLPSHVNALSNALVSISNMQDSGAAHVVD